MNVQLDWQVVDDDWESIVKTGVRTRLRLPGWVLYIVAAVVALFVVCTAVGARYRYQRTLRQITVQIQDVIDLEAHALVQGDIARYLALQDVSLPNWVAQQAACLAWECPEVAATGPVPNALSMDVCPLATPVHVVRVEMRGDVAWVEVVQHLASLRQVRFYRQTPQGWLHTAPHAAFWQDPVERTSGRVRVRACRRDLLHIESQVAHITGVVDKVCATLDCPADVGLEVHFTPYDIAPMLSGPVLTLASPWLEGMPIDASQDETYTRSLTYWAVYGVVSQMVRSDACRWPNPPLPLDVAFEELYSWPIQYSRSDRYDADALSEMLGAMRNTCRP